MLTVRNFSLADVEQCVALIKRGHDANYSQERFEWLHLKNPWGTSEIVLAEDNGRIVGIYSVIKKRVSIGTAFFVGGRDIDPVVDPEYRGKGIFSQMLKYALTKDDGIDFHFNFANKASTPGFLRKGWEDVGKIKECLLQLEPDSRSLKRSALYLLCSIKTVTSRQATGKVDVIDELPELINTHIESPLLQVVRDYDYYKWRYVDNPDGEYIFVSDSQMTPVDNFLVGHLSKNGSLLCVDDSFTSAGATPSSVRMLSNFARSKGIKEVRSWLSAHEELTSKMLYNPARSKEGVSLLVFPRDGRNVPPAVFDLNNWIISPGDLECM